MQGSKHESVGQRFLTDHPFGTDLTRASIGTWVENNANGDLISERLAIADPVKRGTALVRDLNDGLASQTLTEDRRGRIVATEAKLGHYRIISYDDYTHAEAVGSFARSAGASMAPFDRALKRLTDVHVDQLPPERQDRNAQDREDIKAVRTPVAQTYEAETHRRMLSGLQVAGLLPPTATVADMQRAMTGINAVQPLQKLLRKLS